MGVDTHAHVFTQALTFVHAGEGYIPDYDATLETFMAKLASHGLSHAVLIQPSFLGADNDHLLRCVEKYVDRLRGIVIVDSTIPKARLLELQARGVVGVRFIEYGGAVPDWSDPAWSTLANHIAELDWVAEIYAPASALKAIADPLLRRGCKLLIDHYGRPDPNQRANDPGFKYLLSMAESGHVWVDLSGPYRNGDGELGEQYSKQYLTQLRSAFGLERLLWGSDWPCVRYEPWQNYAASWSFLTTILPDPIERTEVLWRTPAELFGL